MDLSGERDQLFLRNCAQNKFIYHSFFKKETAPESSQPTPEVTEPAKNQPSQLLCG